MTASGDQVDAWIRSRAKKAPSAPTPPPPSHRGVVDLKQGDRAANVPTTKPTPSPDQWIRAIGRTKARVIEQAIQDELEEPT